jgi:hypothetical protein
MILVLRIARAVLSTRGGGQRRIHRHRGATQWQWLALYLFWCLVLAFAVYLAVTP